MLWQPVSARPGGLALALNLLWPGAAYGTIDTLFLSVFSVVATWKALRKLGWTERWPGRIAAGVLSLLASLMVIGAGPVGCLHAALDRVRGADRVFIADIAAGRLELARPFGPDVLIDASQVDLGAEARRLTGCLGPDVVISATPAPSAVVQAVQMAKKGGRILMFGGPPKDDSKPSVDMNTVHYNGHAPPPISARSSSSSLTALCT